MNPYDRYLLPWLIDKSCGLGLIMKRRSQLIPRARGRVLEIGVGTGHNLAFYDHDRVTELIALDPAEQMHRRARERAAAAGLDVRMLGLSAERIPLEDGEIDTVVTTFTLCTVPDAAAAVAELRRVLAPDGRLIYAEHGRAPESGVRRWQRRLDPVWGALAGGCHLGRDMPALLGERFALTELEQGYLPGPRFSCYLYSGVADPA